MAGRHSDELDEAYHALHVGLAYAFRAYLGLRQQPKWADLLGMAPDMTLEQLTGEKEYPEYTERIEYETRPVWRGCRCGHPGAGCYCTSEQVRTGRTRIIREFEPQVGEWTQTHKEEEVTDG